MAIGVLGNTGGVIGVGSIGRRSRTPDAKLGTTIIGSDGYAWVYVRAMGSIVADQVDVNVTASFIASDGGGTYINTSAFEDDDYGWVRSPEKVA